MAVLPFFNLSERRNAGEILALLFMRHLSSFGTFRVIDTGDVRQQLLQARIIMDGGISISDAELVAAHPRRRLRPGRAGAVLPGLRRAGGTDRASTSRRSLIERKSRKVVWSSHSYNDGDDGVRFFGRGRSTNRPRDGDPDGQARDRDDRRTVASERAAAAQPRREGSHDDIELLVATALLVRRRATPGPTSVVAQNQALPVKDGRPVVATVSDEPIALDELVLQLDPPVDTDAPAAGVAASRRTSNCSTA